MSVTHSNQANPQNETGLDDSAQSSPGPCEYCMDLKTRNFEDKGYKYKPFLFKAFRVMAAKRIECPYCNLLINGLQLFDDINSRIGVGNWELRGTHSLVLKGTDNGTKHQLEFYITPGTYTCKYDRRRPFFIALTIPLDRRREIANPSNLYHLFQTCPFHLG